MQPQLPDQLPLKRVRHWGLPFHGLVRANQMRLINGTTKLYSEFATPTAFSLGSLGEALRCAGPAAADPTRTPEQIATDEAAGYDWRAYAFLSGVSRNIGGQNLGQDAWLYCDGASTWKVRAALVRPTYDSITVKVYLSALFGRFARDGAELASETLLASLAYVPRSIRYSGGVFVSWYENEYRPITTDMSLFVWPKADGSEALIAIGYEYVSPYGNVAPLGNKATYESHDYNAQVDPTNWVANDAFRSQPMYCLLSGVMKVTLSGTGSVAAGSVGSGITASLELHKQMDDIVTVTWTHEPFDKDPAHLAVSTTVMTQNFLFGYAPDGDPINATYVKTEVHTPIADPFGSSPPGYLYYNVVATHNVQYCGETIEYQYESIRFYDSYGTGAYQVSMWVMPDDSLCADCAPWFAIDTAFGDRTTLFVESCQPILDPTATIHAHYVGPDGAHHQYDVTAGDFSTLPGGMIAPTVSKAHGQVSNNPVAQELALAGEWPAHCCWV